MHICKICSNFAAKIEKENFMVATQPTFNQVFDLACMLPRQEQQELVQKVQYLIHLNAPSSITKEELMARLERADTQIDEGHYMEHEAAKQHFQSRMAMKSAWL